MVHAAEPTALHSSYVAGDSSFTLAPWTGPQKAGLRPKRLACMTLSAAPS